MAERKALLLQTAHVMAPSALVTQLLVRRHLYTHCFLIEQGRIVDRERYSRSMVQHSSRKPNVAESFVWFILCLTSKRSMKGKLAR